MGNTHVIIMAHELVVNTGTTCQNAPLFVNPEMMQRDTIVAVPTALTYVIKTGMVLQSVIHTANLKTT